jgi:hypothetical protein
MQASRTEEFMYELTITVTVVVITLAIMTFTITGFRLYLDRLEDRKVRNVGKHLVKAWAADDAHCKLMKGDW